jgi:redox-sensitive bicupin YhaK (pirin superfamily)
MSGPVELEDLEASEQWSLQSAFAPIVSENRLAEVGAMQVRRALPTRGRRTVGAWCFADHFGPAQVNESFRPDIGPHPHMGLQTVTWLLDGHLIHRDSLGSEQPIRPGQLNLMTAGNGVAHAEEAPDGHQGVIHGVQLWVAQPSDTRHGPAAFEHHPQLGEVELDGCTATVLIGEFATAVSPARRDSDHVGVDLSLRPGSTAIPLDPRYEYALIVTGPMISIQDIAVGAEQLVYLGSGRDELVLRSAGANRALLLGGVPFAEQLLMWWNFVGRTRDEIDAAYDDWDGDTGRFGRVASSLPRVSTLRPHWRPATA